MNDPKGSEFLSIETHGFVDLDTFSVSRSSAGLGWSSVFMSIQSEAPYVRSFDRCQDIFICLVRSGSVRGNVEAGRSRQRLWAPPGSVTVLPDQSDLMVDLRAPIETTHLYLRRAVLDEVAAKIYHGDPSSIEIIARFGILEPVLEHMCHAISDALDGDPEASKFYVHSISRAIAAQLIRKHSISSKKRPASLEGRLSVRQLGIVRERIEASLGQRLTISAIASELGMSADHFGRLFKRETGTTVYQLVLQCRVDRAKNLLTDTEMAIAEIAHECGFGDQMHLTRAFGRITGATPAAFRRYNFKKKVRLPEPPQEKPFKIEHQGRTGGGS